MIGIGIDTVEVERFRQALRSGPGIADRLFTPAEQAYGRRQRDPAERLAARFAAKEAVMKALGVGLGAFAFRDVEVVKAPSGAPSLVPHRPGCRPRGPAGRHVAGTCRSPTPASWPRPSPSPCKAAAVIPVLTPEEMKAIDRAAPEPVEVLIERAGAAVARAALAMLGGAYGRRVVVVAGKGNNGADGRVAADRLAPPGRPGGRRRRRRRARPAARRRDLVIDAAYGTGFRGDYPAPDPAGAPVLAVDIPSGVDGLTGEAGDGRGAGRPPRSPSPP